MRSQTRSNDRISGFATFSELYTKLWPGERLHVNGCVQETASSCSSTVSEKNSSSCLFMDYHALLPAAYRYCARSGKSVREAHELLPRVSVPVQLSPDRVTHRCSAGAQSPVEAWEAVPDLPVTGHIPPVAA